MNFYWGMLLGAIAIAGGIILIRPKLNQFVWRCFWIGVAFGLCWEIPLHFLGPRHSTDPLYVNHADWPVLPIIQPFAAAIWDGALFLAGVALLLFIFRKRRLDRFRWRELLVLVLWGVSSALMVEVVAAGVAWSYVPQPWNPLLFEVNDAPITLFPPLLWALLPAIYYGAILRSSSDSHDLLV